MRQGLMPRKTELELKISSLIDIALDTRKEISAKVAAQVQLEALINSEENGLIVLKCLNTKLDKINKENYLEAKIILGICKPGKFDYKIINYSTSWNHTKSKIELAQNNESIPEPEKPITRGLFTFPTMFERKKTKSSTPTPASETSRPKKEIKVESTRDKTPYSSTKTITEVAHPQESKSIEELVDTSIDTSKTDSEKAGAVIALGKLIISREIAISILIQLKLKLDKIYEENFIQAQEIVEMCKPINIGIGVTDLDYYNLWGNIEATIKLAKTRKAPDIKTAPAITNEATTTSLRTTPTPALTTASLIRTTTIPASTTKTKGNSFRPNIKATDEKKANAEKINKNKNARTKSYASILKAQIKLKKQKETKNKITASINKLKEELERISSDRSSSAIVKSIRLDGAISTFEKKLTPLIQQLESLDALSGNNYKLTLPNGKTYLVNQEMRDAYLEIKKTMLQILRQTPIEERKKHNFKNTRAYDILNMHMDTGINGQIASVFGTYTKSMRQAIKENLVSQPTSAPAA